MEEVEALCLEDSDTVACVHQAFFDDDDKCYEFEKCVFEMPNAASMTGEVEEGGDVGDGI
jgi:hypothetical protein